MNERAILTGHCLCGAVKFTATGVPHEVGACHCTMCQRWTGGPAIAVKVAGMDFEGEEHLTRFRSSDWAERGFCSTCGSNLFYRIVGTDDYYVTAGVFDDPSGFWLASQIFIDEKPDYYDFANETKMLTGEEVFEAVAKGKMPE
ncbi:MAG: GFA family protein [Paracoccaceae bacterium]|nr:GFA family protein [Paracoccaceae bacterium]